jgi:hypothetical protein
MSHPFLTPGKALKLVSVGLPAGRRMHFSLLRRLQLGLSYCTLNPLPRVAWKEGQDLGLGQLQRTQQPLACQRLPGTSEARQGSQGRRLLEEGDATRDFRNVAQQFRFEMISDLTVQPRDAYLLAAQSAPDEVRQTAVE